MKTETENRAIVGLVCILVATCLIVSAGAQPTPVYIYGFAFDTVNAPQQFLHRGNEP